MLCYYNKSYKPKPNHIEIILKKIELVFDKNKF